MAFFSDLSDISLHQITALQESQSLGKRVYNRAMGFDALGRLVLIADCCHSGCWVSKLEKLNIATKGPGKVDFDKLEQGLDQALEEEAGDDPGMRSRGDANEESPASTGVTAASGLTEDKTSLKEKRRLRQLRENMKKKDEEDPYVRIAFEKAIADSILQQAPYNMSTVGEDAERMRKLVSFFRQQARAEGGALPTLAIQVRDRHPVQQRCVWGDVPPLDRREQHLQEAPIDVCPGLSLR